MSDDHDRIMALEMALAHAEQAISDLSEVIQAQTRDHDRLARRLQLLEARLEQALTPED